MVALMVVNVPTAEVGVCAAEYLLLDCKRSFTRFSVSTPMLLKDIFEEQMGRTMDAAFLEKLAAFNGHLFSTGLTPTRQE